MKRVTEFEYRGLRFAAWGPILAGMTGEGIPRSAGPAAAPLGSVGVISESAVE